MRPHPSRLLRIRRPNAARLPTGWRYAERHDPLLQNSVLAIDGVLIFGVFRTLNPSAIHWVGPPVITLDGKYSQVVRKRRNYDALQPVVVESTSASEPNHE